MYSMLIVDDEDSIRYSLKRLFQNQSYDITEAINGQEAIKHFNLNPNFDVVIIDVRLPDTTGLEVLKEFKKINPQVLAIIITSFGTTEIAIESMKFGAYDYITKPFDIPMLQQLVDRALYSSRAMKTRVEIGSEYSDKTIFNKDNIIGNSKKMQEIYKQIGKVAESSATVIISGESGVGKELVARAIFQNSKRKNSTFLTVNCAAIPDNLLESELFGYEKGAFTGAVHRRIGRFEQCDNGTIFLDEIGDISPHTQAKLLRILQEGTFERLGSNDAIKVDVRIITATNKNLEKLIEENTFREDLYYRLNVVSIFVPPLKERKEDVPKLVKYFIAKTLYETGKRDVSISNEAIKMLTYQEWKGNVRELENTIKNAIIMLQGNIILPQSLPVIEKFNRTVKPQLVSSFELSKNDIEQYKGHLYKHTIEEMEEKLIKQTLKLVNNNQSKASEYLGISRVMLRERIQRYNISI